MRSKLVLLFVLLSVVAAACGGGTEPLTTSTAVSEPSVVTSIAGQPDGTPIGPDGGTVTSADGLFTVEIPAGALSEIVNIGVEIGSAADLGVEESLLAGPIYQLTPDGTIFDAPVTTIRRLSASDLGIADNTVPFFHVFQGLADGWVPLSTETTREGEFLLVVADTVHFSPNVVVETTKVFGSKTVKLELEPAAFSAPIGSSASTSWSRTLPGSSESFGSRAVLTFGGAVAAHEIEFPGVATAFCGEAAGEGTYGVQISGDLEGVADSEGIDLLLLTLLGAEPLSVEHYTVAAKGTATCTKPDTSLIDTIAGVASGQIDFQLHENSPPGSEYTAEFEIDTDASARRVKKTQKPSNQITEGPIDPVTGIYFTLAETDTYFEVYIGGVCPEPDGAYYVGGYTFGGPPSMADGFQASLDSIPGFNAAVSTPQSISVDPALVPSCEGLDSDPWAFANAIRSFFGPSGSIPNAQWDLIFTGELEAGG